MSSGPVEGHCLCQAVVFEYDAGAQLDALLPLRELSPCDIVSDHDLDFRAARQFSFHAGSAALFPFVPRCEARILRHVRFTADL
jgi:hypothetical protein